jgi:PAS domain S-box-containing protein
MRAKSLTLRVRLALEWFTIGLVASAIALAILWSQATAPFDELLYDSLSAVSAPKADDGILLVTIDDHSLAQLGRWPWDRATHARFLEVLNSKQPRSITLDILMSEASAGDQVLAAAMQSSTAPVFLPLHFAPSGFSPFGEDSVTPASSLQQPARRIGHVNLTFDADGIVRQTSLCAKKMNDTEPWPHIAELVVRGESARPSAVFAGTLPCDRTLRIPFSPRRSFSEISYVDMLDGNVPADFVRGKDVIIGSTAAGMGDSFPTPNAGDGLLPGIEIIANIVGAVRRNDFISSLSPVTIGALSILPIWLLMFGFLKWQPNVAIATSIGSIAVMLALSAALLSRGIWFPSSAALFGILAAYPLWGWRRLQAMSDFMTVRLARLNADTTATFPPLRRRDLDVVGQQSEALAGAIDQLGDLRRYLRDTLAGLPDPMFVTDTHGKITLGNQLFKNNLGLTRASTLNEVIDQIVDPKQRPLVDAYLDRDVGDTPEFVRFSSSDARSFVLRKAPVSNERGQVQGHIYYLTDITALARAEAQREEVLQLLSHDMRAPQSTIIALLAGEITEDSKNRIERNARRTMQLAQDFVEIARMSEAEFMGEDILIADLVREVADGLWPLAHERGIKFTFDDRSDSAFVLGEPESLSRALYNLIDNAIKFSPDNGSVHFEIGSLVRDAQPHVVITISDHGKGIDSHILPRLFGRFISSDKQVGRAKGTGLGLMFVQAVADRHGGNVSAHNRDGGGASFTLTLPEAPDA